MENGHSYWRHSARWWVHGWEMHEVFVQSVVKMMFIFPLSWICHRLLFIIALLPWCSMPHFWPFSKQVVCRLIRTVGRFLCWCMSETCWPASKPFSEINALPLSSHSNFPHSTPPHPKPKKTVKLSNHTGTWQVGSIMWIGEMKNAAMTSDNRTSFFRLYPLIQLTVLSKYLLSDTRLDPVFRMLNNI